MATTSLPTSQQLDFSNDALLIKDVVVSGTVYQTATAGTLVAAGSTITLTSANNGETVLLDTAAGSAVTLPAATGAGTRYTFLVKTLATSNSHTVATAGSDKFAGVITAANTSTNVVTGWPSANNKTTITLNRTTTGSVTIGEWITVEDIATNVWSVRGSTTQSGTAATPFS